MKRLPLILAVLAISGAGPTQSHADDAGLVKGWLTLCNQQAHDYAHR